MPVAAGGSAPAPMAPLSHAWNGHSSQGRDPVMACESGQDTAHHDIYAIFILSLSSIGMIIPSVGWSMKQPRQDLQ